MSIRGNAFTFVEVTIAIAILAFTLVVMIGLLTVGLSSEKSSSEDTRIGAMASYVMATERTNAFTVVSQPNYTNSYFFDALGDVTNATPSPTYYISCTVSNTMATNSTLLATMNVNSAAMTNMAPMKAVFVYSRLAPAASQKTNIFYFNRANE